MDAPLTEMGKSIVRVIFFGHIKSFIFLPVKV